ncbi:MAG: SHOCT-like domain-containing protein [Anaerolineales bacterium]
MSNENERRLILEMIDSGKISAEDGLHLLQALPSSEREETDKPLISMQSKVVEQPLPDAEPTEESSTSIIPVVETARRGEENPTSAEYSANGEMPTSKPDFNRWRRFWVIPLWIGVAVTITGSLLMVWAVQSAGVGFWFTCAAVPFALGVLILALAWQSRTAHWLHLRVQQRPGEWPRTIAFSFPLPLRISSWFMRTFRRYIPGMETAPIDEMLATLETSTSPEEPLYIEVEEEDGERVEIYIG